MTKRLAGLAAFLLLLVPLVSAHPAPDPRTFETRLLADCVDDIPGSHDGNIIGYDLHALDLWEYWDGSAEQVGFRLILNGNAGATVTLSMDVAGATQEYGWIQSEGEWTGTGWDSSGMRDDVYLDDSSEPVNDGDRFALIGVLSKSSLGGDGTVLSGFAIESDSNLGADDDMPGNNGSGGCESAFERPDYTLGENSIADAYLSEPLGEQDITLLADEEYFVDVTAKNQVKALKQQVTMTITGVTGDVDASFHDPSSGDYTEESIIEIASRSNPGSQKLVHLALNAPDGASGTVTLALTTDVVLKDGTIQPGGRVVRTVTYSVQEEMMPPPTEPEDTNDPADDGKDTPAPSVLIASVALLAAATWRRR